MHSAILGVALARELGLRRLQIKDLTIGILLADLGKMRLPMELLRCQRRLERAEVEIIELHVKFGLEIAENIKGMSASSMAIIGAHHERFNGSGYPKGLSGGDIPLFGRIAGLADAFDAITSERAYARPIPAHEAVQEMYASTIDVFQRELLECLIRVLGTYPVGSIVELSDGAAAMVMALNREPAAVAVGRGFIGQGQTATGAGEVARSGRRRRCPRTHDQGGVRPARHRHRAAGA